VSLDITPGIRQLIIFPLEITNINSSIASHIISYIISGIIMYIIRWVFMFQLHRNINTRAIRYLNRYII